jgi:hypothetical protein
MHLHQKLNRLALFVETFLVSVTLPMEHQAPEKGKKIMNRKETIKRITISSKHVFLQLLLPIQNKILPISNP